MKKHSQFALLALSTLITFTQKIICLLIGQSNVVEKALGDNVVFYNPMLNKLKLFIK